MANSGPRAGKQSDGKVRSRPLRHHSHQRENRQQRQQGDVFAFAKNNLRRQYQQKDRAVKQQSPFDARASRAERQHEARGEDRRRCKEKDERRNDRLGSHMQSLREPNRRNERQKGEWKIGVRHLDVRNFPLDKLLGESDEP